MNIGIGLALSFSYILFLQFASQFSSKETLVRCWQCGSQTLFILVIGLVLYKLAPK